MSWERSAFGVLAGGALVLLKSHGPFAPGRVALASIAGLLGLLILALGHLRSRRIGADGHDIAPPRMEVVILGYGTAIFAMSLVVVLLLTA